MRRHAALASLLVLAAVCCVSCAGAVASVAAPVHRQRAAAKPKTRAKARSARPDLTAALAPLSRDDGGHFAVAVDDLASGSQAAYGGAQEFVTASIVKVDILVTLLYQAQEAGQALSAED